MVPDVGSTYQYRNRRIRETLEDALDLLRFQAPGCFERRRLAQAATQINSASDGALAQMLHDPKVCMWSLVDLTPLIESPKSEEAVQMAESLAEQVNYLALGLSHLDRKQPRKSSFRRSSRAFQNLESCQRITRTRMDSA